MKFARVFLGLLFLFLIWWNWPRPAVFLERMQIQVPKNAYISHSERWYLTTEAHFVRLTLPKVEATTLVNQFKKKEDFEDVTNSLKKNFKDFRSGLEDFFPARPIVYSGGRFTTVSAKHTFFFRY